MKVTRILVLLKATGETPMNMKDARTPFSYDRGTSQKPLMEMTIGRLEVAAIRTAETSVPN